MFDCSMRFRSTDEWVPGSVRADQVVYLKGEPGDRGTTIFLVNGQALWVEESVKTLSARIAEALNAPAIPEKSE